MHSITVADLILLGSFSRLAVAWLVFIRHSCGVLLEAVFMIVAVGVNYA